MNTFGAADSRQFPLCDVRNVRDNRRRYRREMLPLLNRVNHFYCPTGRYPFRGWILLDRFSYNQLSLYSTDLRLNISNTAKPNNVKTLRNLSIVQARCATRGLASDPSALYLIELTDARGLLHNHWFQAPTTAAYNVRAPAYPQAFYPWTLNSGAPWTWSTMLGDLWASLSTYISSNLGTWPGLPITPTGTPEGFWFTGVPGWYALNDVLEYLGLTVACDLTQANPFTIVVSGATDAALTALQTKYITNLEDDLEWIDTGAARVPKQVITLFRRRNSIYGSEETVRYDSPFQWESGAYYSVTTAAPARFTGAAGTHFMWSDFTVRYDQDSNPLAADVATATSIATERTTQYYNRIRADGSMTQTYTGALPFTTGSQVDGVCWYMDSEGDGGWRTQLVHGYLWPDLWDTRPY